MKKKRYALLLLAMFIPFSVSALNGQKEAQLTLRSESEYVEIGFSSTLDKKSLNQETLQLVESKRIIENNSYSLNAQSTFYVYWRIYLNNNYNLILNVSDCVNTEDKDNTLTIVSVDSSSLNKGKNIVERINELTFTSGVKEEKITVSLLNAKKDATYHIPITLMLEVI